jgi:hypothetical protein
MEEDDYYYRNADPRDHRTPAGSRPRAPVGAPAASYLPPPAAASYSPPPAGYGYSPPASYAPPAYGLAPVPGPYGFAPTPGPYGFAPTPPGPYGYPSGYPGYPSMFNGRTIGRVIRAATPLVVALLGLPTAPTPVASTGDTATDLKGSLTNEANQILYQTALAEAAKRDETVYAIGHGIGLLLEKGMS